MSDTWTEALDTITAGETRLLNVTTTRSAPPLEIGAWATKSPGLLIGGAFHYVHDDESDSLKWTFRGDFTVYHHEGRPIIQATFTPAQVLKFVDLIAPLADWSQNGADIFADADRIGPIIANAVQEVQQ